MRQLAKLAVAAVFSCACASTFAAGGNVVHTLGMRLLNDDRWAPVEDQGQLGVLLDFQIAHSPFYVAAGLQHSSRQETEFGDELTASVADASLGAKFMPTLGHIRPYFGIGLASVSAAYEVESSSGDQDDNDGSLAYYYGAGLLVRFGHFDFGADVRHIAGTDLELFGDDINADSTVISTLFGWGWGQ